MVEQALVQELHMDEALEPKLSESMKYSLMAGGKRLRPVLLMAAADAVLRSNSDLAYVQYLKGAISYSTQEYENAVTCYQKALDLYGDNATFYYALAYAYDALGDYQAAYIASGKCKDMVPTVNHEEDWYGLGYHNVTFYERVKAEVEK